MKQETFINENRPHESAIKHVSGKAYYTDDIPEPPGTLYGAIGWSKKAHPNQNKGWPHEPVAKHVQGRESHVIGTDHQRNQKIPKGTGQDRNDHKEDHHGRMHGKERGVKLGRDLTTFRRKKQVADDRHVGPGPGQLPANSQGQQATNGKPQQRRKQELDPDDLMISGEDIGANKMTDTTATVSAFTGRCLIVGFSCLTTTHH